MYFTPSNLKCWSQYIISTAETIHQIKEKARNGILKSLFTNTNKLKKLPNVEIACEKVT